MNNLFKITMKNTLTIFLGFALILTFSAIPSLATAQTYYPYTPYNPYGSNNYCYNFTSDMQIGSTGAQVEALHNALSREGFNRTNSGGVSIQTFNEETASLVSGFQEKYRYDILTPVGYKHGTGFVGSYTRAKLNSLYNSYNCGGNTSGNISYSVTANKSNYNYGEDIILTLRATNNSNYERTLSFNTGCQTSYRIGTYDSSSNQACTLAFTNVRIPAYNSYTWTMVHRQSNFNLTSGTYSVTAKVIGHGEANTTITIEYGSGGGNTGTNYPRVISPNGGEYLRKGNYYNLSWQMPNVNYFQAQAVNISLIPENYNSYYPNQYQNSYSTCPVGATCPYTGSTYTPTYYPNQNYYHQNSYMILQNTYLTSFNWYVGSTPNSWSQVPQGNYRLQVCLAGTNICDTSDNYFTINNY